ncbi:MAG TPA: hypothetical protein VIN09_12130 [Chloroflexota bacterium]
MYLLYVAVLATERVHAVSEAFRRVGASGVVLVEASQFLHDRALREPMIASIEHLLEGEEHAAFLFLAPLADDEQVRQVVQAVGEAIGGFGPSTGYAVSVPCQVHGIPPWG